MWCEVKESCLYAVVIVVRFPKFVKSNEIEHLIFFKP